MTLFSRAYKMLFNMPASRDDKARDLGRALFNEAKKDKPNVKKMLRLITEGADVNIRNCDDASVLIYVAGRDAFSDEDAKTLAIKLLEAGADINLKTSCGNTAGIWSTRQKRDTLTCYLIEHGADVTAQNDKGQTLESLAEQSRASFYPQTKTLAAIAALRQKPSPKSSAPKAE